MTDRRRRCRAPEARSYALAVAAAVLAGGCAASRPLVPPSTLRSGLSTFEIVAPPAPPTVRAAGRAESAANAAAAGCLWGGIYGLQAPPWGCLLLGPVIAGVAGFGAAAFPGAAHPEQAAAWLAAGLQAAGGPGELAAAVRRRLRDRLGGPPAKGGDRPALVLTVEQLRLAPASPWTNGMAPGWGATSLRVAARLLDSRGAPAVRERTLTARGPPIAVSAETFADADLARRQVSSLVEAAAEQIADEVAWLYPLPDQESGPTAGSGGFRSGFGLRVAEPPRRWWSTLSPVAPSRQPALSWEAFPRDSDRAATPDVAGRVSDVVYDLRLARAAGTRRHLREPSGEVYARDNLPEPHHALEMPLEEKQAYFWTVRARFTLDGERRATEWASPGEAGRWTAPPLNARSHTFLCPGR